MSPFTWLEFFCQWQNFNIGENHTFQFCEPKIFTLYRSHKSVFSVALHNFGSLCQSFDSKFSARKWMFTKYYSISNPLEKLQQLFRNIFHENIFTQSCYTFSAPCQYLRWESANSIYVDTTHLLATLVRKSLLGNVASPIDFFEIFLHPHKNKPTRTKHWIKEF